MIDKRIGKRIKECREKLHLTQEKFAEKLTHRDFLGAVERGASFPRCEKLIAILNGLEVSSADAVFCDVLTHSHGYRESCLSEELSKLPPEEQKRILDVMEVLIKEALLRNS